VKQWWGFVFLIAANAVHKNNWSSYKYVSVGYYRGCQAACLCKILSSSWIQQFVGYRVTI